MGSCYLAEVYLAFGMIGVVLTSVFIGWAIDRLNRVDRCENIFVKATIFFFVRRLFTLPRDDLFSWTGSFEYFAFVLLMFSPYYLYLRKKAAGRFQK